LLAYTTNGHFLCSAEFWIMSIYLPFGIALFQANVTQLRSIAEQQEALLLRQSSYNGTPALSGQSWLHRVYYRFARLSQAQKSHCFIAVGMVVQVCLQRYNSIIANTHSHICSSSSQLSSMLGRRHCKATGQAMGTYRITRARSSAARRWNGSRPHSGSFSGRGSTDPTSFTESGTFAMLTDGVCRPSSASSLGMSLCLWPQPLVFQADLAVFLAHLSGSPQSSPPTSSPSTHGLSHPCGSPLASSSCNLQRSSSQSSKSGNTRHQCTRDQSPSTAPIALSGPQHPDPKK
jgi:hypothetical protein